MDTRTICHLCRAGASTSYSWKYSQVQRYLNLKSYELLPSSKEIFSSIETLRSGYLHQCRECGAYWYLDADEDYMTHVENTLLATIRAWSQRALPLSDSQQAAVDSIGANPVTMHGHYRVFTVPCAITTQENELLDPAYLVFQNHAPMERHITYRLASDIKKIEPSRYALTYEVRKKTHRAPEIAKDFDALQVQFRSGEKALLWREQSFLDEEGIDPKEVVVCEQGVKYENMPKMYAYKTDIVYFIADPPDATLLKSRPHLSFIGKKTGFFSRIRLFFQVLKQMKKDDSR